MSTTPLEQRSTTGEQSPVVFRWPRPTLGWLWWLPVVIGVVYGIAILMHLREILDSVWLSSDNDIDGVLAHMSMHAHSGALMTTGDFPHYETMAFTLATRTWPLYRVIWKLAPVFFALVGLGAVGWSVWRSFGRWQAALVAGVLVCFGGGGAATVTAGGLATVFAIDAHANTVITAALCGAILVWVVPRAERMPAGRLVSAAVVIGVLGGLVLAGDSFYLAWGLAPLVVVSVLAAWRGPQDQARRLLGFGALALASTLLTSVLFAALMRSVGVRGFAASYQTLTTFVTPKGFLTNFQTLLRAFPSLTAASFYGKAVNSRAELEFITAVLLFGAMLAVFWAVRRRIANALPRAAGGGDPVGARFVHTTFWATVLVAGIVVFMVGSPNPWTTDGRYLLGPYVAVAALLPVLVARGLGWKLLVAAGASVFAFSALYQFPSGVLQEMPAGYQTAGTARAVAAYAKAEHVAVGYGEYWTSIGLMWNSEFKVDVYPIQRCQKQWRKFCTFHEISVSGWDRPHGKVTSMLVTNPKARQIRTSPRVFGPALTATRIGGLTLYIYPYDIATRLKHERGLTMLGKRRNHRGAANRRKTAPPPAAAPPPVTALPPPPPPPPVPAT